jgi:calcineurin-like phosphoesterase
MVIFHNYVNLPEGMGKISMKLSENWIRLQTPVNLMGKIIIHWNLGSPFRQTHIIYHG